MLLSSARSSATLPSSLKHSPRLWERQLGPSRRGVGPEQPRLSRWTMALECDGSWHQPKVDVQQKRPQESHFGDPGDFSLRIKLSEEGRHGALWGVDVPPGIIEPCQPGVFDT